MGSEPEYEATVEPADVGQRLDQYLAAPLGSRARAVRMIEAGLVSVDGRAVQKRRTLNAGEQVLVLPYAPAGPGATSPLAPGAGVPYSVVYEDEHLLVVDKPAGVVVHPARGHQTGTLAQALADRAAGGEDPQRAGIVHRLDRDTSGLLVVAKSEPVHRALRELLQSRTLRREYLTLVDGTPPARSGTIEAPIGRDRTDRMLHSLDTDTPKEARTHFEVLESLHGAALLLVALDTGRTHQIRVHLKAIGHPVVGDRVYGGTVRYQLTRQFLHAARLGFPHPITGANVDLESPLPPELARALELARSESA